MLPVTLDHIRVSLHILAAAIWVGGQLAVVGLLPVVRSLGDDAPRAVARQFARIAWPAYAALVITGLWNLTEVSLSDRTTEYHITLLVKLLLVAASGTGAALHGVARSRAALALWGAVGLFAAVAALVLGAVLRG